MVNHTAARPTAHVAAQLSRQAKKTIDAFYAADEAGAYTGEHTDRLAALEAEVSFHPAGGAEGALFQLAALRTVLTYHAGDHPAWRSAERLISHLVTFVEEATDTDRGAFDGYYFTSREYLRRQAAA